MKPVILALFIAVAAGLLLAGCGQKGALYLPGHNPNPPKPLIKPPTSGQSGQSSGRGADKASTTPAASSQPNTNRAEP
ncbi:lipoprotein [Salinisphaera sp. LB1]|uniref:LPS translocon maturation chaperone LptM n=1 Tax=Salinisphaera sp. LB1 TaxID=2183911 RepID=UPI000D706453|nr:lipoprotein [Salinisphaera sp. LB1]